MNISNIPELENISNAENVSCRSVNDTVENVLRLNKEWKTAIDSVMIVLMIVIMFSIACELSWSKMKFQVAHPTGIGIGLVCQFFLLPLTAYAVMRSSSIRGLHATEMLVISCCPGGILATAFTYFCDGNLALSVSTTSVAALLSLGVTPVNLWIYGRSFETNLLVLPYTELLLAFVSVPTLAGAGMLLRRKFASVARFITRIGRCLGLLLMIACIILEVSVFPQMFVAVPGNVYGVILTLPLLGLCLGYVLAFSFRQDIPSRKTIAIECGIQNIPIALAIIWHSFETQEHTDALLLPCLYAFTTMTGYTALSIAYQLHKQYISQKKESTFELEPTPSL